MREHTYRKEVLDRLARAGGHLNGIRKMVEEGRDCSEILVQLAAVRAALERTGKIIRREHVGHCLVDAVQEGDGEAIASLQRAIDAFL